MEAAAPERPPRFSEDYVRRLLSSTTPENRAEILAYTNAKRAAGLSRATIAGAVFSLTDLAMRLNQAPIRTASPEALQAALADYSKSHAPTSTQIYAGILKAYYKWTDPNDECPRPIKRALKFKARTRPQAKPVVTPEEFRALLANANETDDPREAARSHALFWALWDTGFRLSELLSLRIGDVTLDERGGASMRLRPDAPDLKTGPRTIYVVECVGALKVWLALHPKGADPSAYIFCTLRAPYRAMDGCTVRHVLGKACDEARIRQVTPHLFRHTRATRSAEAGWTEAHLRAFFGWSANSAMASHYVHLSRLAMEERVRADARLDPLSAQVREDPQKALTDTVAASVAATIKALKDAGTI